MAKIGEVFAASLAVGRRLCCKCRMAKEGRPSFLKKRSKKLLLICAAVRDWPLGTARWPHEQKFFGSFFQKRTAFFSM
jgi:hypothetical protein